MKHKLLIVGGVVVAALLAPVVAGAATANTTISSVVSAVLSITSSGTVNVNTTPSGSGVQTISSDTVTVSTNNAAGYTLKLAESTSATDMVSGGDTIPASSGTQGSPVAQSANTWGYRVDSIGGFGAGPTSPVSNQPIGSLKFAGVPLSASPDTLKTTGATATNDQTTVWYGVATNTSTPSGTYTNTVTYTAVTN